MRPCRGGCAGSSCRSSRPSASAAAAWRRWAWRGVEYGGLSAQEDPDFFGRWALVLRPAGRRVGRRRPTAARLPPPAGRRLRPHAHPLVEHQGPRGARRHRPGAGALGARGPDADQGGQGLADAGVHRQQRRLRGAGHRRQVDPSGEASAATSFWASCGTGSWTRSAATWYGCSSRPAIAAGPRRWRLARPSRSTARSSASATRRGATCARSAGQAQSVASPTRKCPAYRCKGTDLSAAP